MADVPNLTIDIEGKPHPKARPRMVRGKVWTPSTPHEDAVATLMLQYKGAFAGATRLALLAWFYGADPRSDGDNLWKLVADAAVKAGVIDDDRFIVHGAFTLMKATGAGNPFPDNPSTRIRIGGWDW